MRKLSWCSLVVAMALSIIISGCGQPSTAIKASLSQEFTLAIGQKADITGENLGIKFLEIKEDSRCPKNVTCIWAGRVSAVIEITGGQASYQMVLTQPGLSGQADKEDYQSYQIAYIVTPYPEAGKQIRNEDYRLSLIVTKR